MGAMVQRTWIVLLLVGLLLAGTVAGCAANQVDQPEQEQEDAAEPQIAEGIAVNGTVVEAAGKSLDIAEKNSYVRSIVSCQWIEKNKLMIQCSLSGHNSQPLYLAVYDVVRDLYVYEQYGKQFVWQNDDLDTLIYVVDYANEGEGSQVLNKKDVVLYESSAQQQIKAISYVPKGIKVEVMDLHNENSQQIIVESAV